MLVGGGVGCSIVPCEGVNIPPQNVAADDVRKRTVTNGLAVHHQTQAKRIIYNISRYSYISHVAGAFRNGELCRITKFSQEVVENGR